MTTSMSQYIAFKAANNEVFVATQRAALNMAYQDITVNTGEIDVVATFTGQVIEMCQPYWSARVMQCVTISCAVIRNYILLNIPTLLYTLFVLCFRT